MCAASLGNPTACLFSLRLGIDPLTVDREAGVPYILIEYCRKPLRDPVEVNEICNALEDSNPELFEAVQAELFECLCEYPTRREDPEKDELMLKLCREVRSGTLEGTADASNLILFQLQDWMEFRNGVRLLHVLWVHLENVGSSDNLPRTLLAALRKTVKVQEDGWSLLHELARVRHPNTLRVKSALKAWQGLSWNTVFQGTKRCQDVDQSPPQFPGQLTTTTSHY
jgi:hypothetical protein